jgi:hypothetical protein
MLKLLFLALALLPLGLKATPTRALTLDSQQMLVADDYDATIYYHLAPNFKDHFYVDLLNSGKALGWAFLDVKIGTLVLWWNKDAAGKPLFDGLASGNKLGYQSLDLTSNTGNAHAPLEGWIKEPQVKLSAGYAMELTQRMNLGLCVQWATLDQTRDAATVDGSGAAIVAGAPNSLSRYLSSYYTSNLKTTSYKNTQEASGLTGAVSLGINAERYALDIKAEAMKNGINNVHQEEDRDVAGTMSGSVTQGLKDKGALSWLAMGKMRVPMSEGALILRGGYFNYDFSTQHTQKGSFSGTGFASPEELAGFDHVDAEENYTVKNWDSMVGWTHAFDKTRGMLVLGLGMNDSLSRQEDLLYGPRPGGSYNSLLTQSRSITINEAFAVPLVIGAELEISKFAKCSGSAIHNLYGTNSSTTVSEAFDSSSGALASRTDTRATSDANLGWHFNTGLGLYFGSFSWDMAINTAFLASSGGWVNPAYQSTLGWGF